MQESILNLDDIIKLSVVCGYMRERWQKDPELLGSENEVKSWAELQEKLEILRQKEIMREVQNALNQ